MRQTCPGYYPVTDWEFDQQQELERTPTDKASSDKTPEREPIDRRPAPSQPQTRG
jgi:hypothetical protein